MKNKWYFILFSACLIQSSCEDFVDVELPDSRIVSETVFTNDETANSAVIGIYNELFKADFVNGDFSSVTMLGELAADNFQTTVINDAMREFEDNDLLTNNPYNLNLWSSAYKIIYMCNSVIDGLNTFQGVSEKTKHKLIAEAQFVRAFVYFYLVNLYGDVPLIQTTDYRENALASRNSITEVHELIIDDLESAAAVLDNTFDNGERLRANKFTALALLARVQLFLEDWEKAEIFSTQVINSSENYTLLNNLDDVFLANSKEAIWQISPAGRGALSLTTNEARVFILTSPPPNSQQPVALTTDFLSVFDEEDLRLQHWIGEFNTENQVYYYPFKYKNNRSEAKIIEYSMVMRLAEQYLIRAEARSHQGKLTEAITDLDKIRDRANLQLISNNTPNIDKETLLDSIRIERNRELFSEWGHRWLDLKRTGTASEILTNKSSWQDSDLLFPIPEDEINKNPNLTQNNGY